MMAGLKVHACTRAGTACAAGFTEQHMEVPNSAPAPPSEHLYAKWVLSTKKVPFRPPPNTASACMRCTALAAKPELMSSKTVHASAGRCRHSSRPSALAAHLRAHWFALLPRPARRGI
jgi:hypothetical protein